jgi:hypothetical protein
MGISSDPIGQESRAWFRVSFNLSTGTEAILALNSIVSLAIRCWRMPGPIAARDTSRKRCQMLFWPCLSPEVEFTGGTEVEARAAPRPGLYSRIVKSDPMHPAQFLRCRIHRPNLTISLATPMECASIWFAIFLAAVSEPKGSFSTLSANTLTKYRWVDPGGGQGPPYPGSP